MTAIRQCIVDILPWSTAQNFAIRCIAIASLRKLWHCADMNIRQEFAIIHGCLNFDLESNG